MYKSIFYEDIKDKENINIIDVREVVEYQQGHIKDSINLPMSLIANQYNELDINKEYYLICHSGARSAMVCDFLSRQGYQVYNLIGGIELWKGELING